MKDFASNACNLTRHGNAAMLCFYLFLLPGIGHCQWQQQVDSLQHHLTLAQHDTIRANLLNDISKIYSQRDFEISMKFGKDALALSRRISFPRGECLALFHIGYAHFRKSQYPKALDYYQRAVGIARDHGFKNEEANFILNIGVIYDMTGDFEKGMKYYRQVLVLAQELDNKHLIASAYQNIAILLIFQNEKERSLQYYEKALQIFDSLQIREEVGIVLQNMGVLYAELFDFEKSDRYLRQSLEIWEADSLPLRRARTLFNLASNSLELGDFASAEEKLLESLNAYNDLGNPRGAGYCVSTLATLYSDLGNYTKAIEYYEESLTTFEQLGLKAEIPGVKVNYALALRNAGQPAKALQNLEEALQLTAGTSDYNTRGNAHHHLGIMAVSRKQYQEAERHFTTADQLFQRSGHAEHHAKNIRYLGQLYESLDNRSQALAHYQRAVEAFPQVFQKNPKLAVAYNSLSQFYLQQSDLEEAKRHNELALKVLLTKEISPDDLAPAMLNNVVSGPELLRVLKTRTDISLAKKDYQGTIATCELAFQLVDSLRKDYRVESKQILVTNASGIFENALKASKELYDLGLQTPEFAFKVIEKHKGYVLKEALSEDYHTAYVGVPDSLLARESLLQSQTSFLQEKILNEEAKGEKADREKIEEWASKKFQKQREFELFRERLSVEYPRYYNWKFKNDVATINEIRTDVLRKNQSLIAYFFGVEKIYMVALDSEQEIFLAVDHDAQLASAIVGLYQQISAKIELKDLSVDLDAFVQQSYLVYRRLLAPALEAMDSDDLIVIPDGYLHYLPVEVLLTALPEPSDNHFNTLPYLVKSHNVSYYHSATLLHQSILNPTEEKSKALLALTPEEDPGTMQSDFLTFRNVELGSIPGAFYEVVNVGKIFDGDVFTGSGVNETNFKETADDYSIIHLAMHGVVDNQNPNFSRLIFSTDQDSLNDGLLHTYELYNMKLDAELVVLSACNSGFGKLAKGEGVMSLGRGFAYAGCPNLLISRWPAADKPTNEIMQYFYRELKSGASKDQALRRAKLRYLEQADAITARPLYWANFVLIGNSDPLNMTKGRYYQWLLLAGGILAFGTFLYLSFRVNPKKPLIKT